MFLNFQYQLFDSCIIQIQNTNNDAYNLSKNYKFKCLYTAIAKKKR